MLPSEPELLSMCSALALFPLWRKQFLSSLGKDGKVLLVFDEIKDVLLKISNEVDIFVCVYIYTHIHTYIYTHLYIHKYVHICHKYYI